jgi:hypothetical protein
MGTRRQVSPLRNPFPGLRPFEPDEDHLFFGREQEIDDLLRRLGTRRFLSVVGTSGSGKSSLVRSGLIPSLHSGSSVKAGSSWRVAVLRPGEDPIGGLAAALDATDVLGGTAVDTALAGTGRVMLDATLRRGSLGLIDAVRMARIPPDDNVLIVVDQFEELFRFQRSRHIANAHDEAVAFVKLLLDGVAQQELPIYVVLTMRSDFIGDCMSYPGLPEAINDSVYLVPRMTRDELRSAITGPVAVAGGKIAPRLVLRMLNDMGDDQDQLPLLQHVLMRTWDHWMARRSAAASIDLMDYEAVGTLHDALSRHADEAYAETGSEERRRTAMLMCKALTDTFSDPRGVRRPTTVADLATICAVDESEVMAIVEIFRRPGRSFLVPPPAVPLTSRSIIDISHESLMRCWRQLMEWAREERASAAQYARLSREATWFSEGAAGLWDDPELELGLRWRDANKPTAAWARQFDESEDGFARAMDFLDRSSAERQREKAERRAGRIRRLQIAWGTAIALLVMLGFALRATNVARNEATRAEANLGLAKQAVDQTLLAAERDPAQIGADVPEMEEFRKDLLERAKGFYLRFIEQKPGDELLLHDMALAHFRLGQASRLLNTPREATAQYRKAIEEFEGLASAHPDNPQYRQLVASAWNWIGETERPFQDRGREAAQAYANALRLQLALVSAYPDSGEYRQELARTYYNRGILHGEIANAGDTSFRFSDANFREAIRLLEPIAARTPGLPRQELARVYNNRASLLLQDPSLGDSAIAMYEEAVRIHEALVRQHPSNREYRFELARFLDNLAGAARDQGNLTRAADANAGAIAQIEELVRAAPSLAIEQADAHTVRGSILQETRTADAVHEYEHSLELFRKFDGAYQEVSRRSEFLRRVTDLLERLVSVSRRAPNDPSVRRVVADGVAFYAGLWQHADSSGRTGEAQGLLDDLRDVLGPLSDGDRQRLLRPHEALQRALARTSSGSR